MNKLIEIMALDMNIQPYTNEPEESFEYRVIYSALGFWCLKSSLSEKENEKGISKNAQSILLHNLAEKYVALCPEAKTSVLISRNADIATFIRNVYEQTGYLLTQDNNSNVLNESGETVRFTDREHLYLGLPELGYSVNGLGIHTESKGVEIALRDFLIRDSFTPEEYLAVHFDECDFDTCDIDLEDDITDDLTDDDKRYLRLKWGKAYKPEEWVRLEQLYEEMTKSYDIQGAGHEDVLKLVCKTSLKANQLLDIGDVDGAQKMVKMYDSLMKSGRFTAAQNKAENGEFLSSIAEFTVLCEKEGFIPRFYTEGPKDRVDETIMDLKGYTHSLVVEEMNLGNLIENAVKQMAEQEAKEEDEDAEEEISMEELDALRDEDFMTYNDFIEEEEEADAEMLKMLEDK